MRKMVRLIKREVVQRGKKFILGIEGREQGKIFFLGGRRNNVPNSMEM